MSCISLKYNDSWLGISQGIDGIRIKHNGGWTVPEKVYLKVNGAWVETCIPGDPTAITTQFNVSTINRLSGSEVRTSQFMPSIINKIENSEVRTSQYSISFIAESTDYGPQPEPHEWILDNGSTNPDGTFFGQTGGLSEMYSSEDVTGKKYYELIMTNSSTFDETISMIGATDATGATWSIGGAYMYIRNGALYGGMAGLSYTGLDYSNNTWYGIALDMDLGKMWIRDASGWKNGDPAAGTDGATFDPASFPRVSIGNGGAAVAFNVNSGEEAFQFGPPAGFVSLTTPEPPIEPPPPAETYTFDGTVLDTNKWIQYNVDAGNETVQNDKLITRGLGGYLWSGGGVYHTTIRDNLERIFTIECDFTLVNARYSNSNPILIGVVPYPPDLSDTYYALPQFSYWLGLGTTTTTGIDQIRFHYNQSSTNPTGFGTVGLQNMNFGTPYKVKISFNWATLLADAWVDDVLKITGAPIPATATTDLDSGYAFATHVSQYETLTEFHIDNLTLEELNN